MTGIVSLATDVQDGLVVDARHAAHQSQVHGGAIGIVQLQTLAKQDVRGLEIQVLGGAAQFLDPACQELIRLLGQHAFDDFAAWPGRCNVDPE